MRPRRRRERLMTPHDVRSSARRSNSAKRAVGLRPLRESSGPRMFARGNFTDGVGDYLMQDPLSIHTHKLTEKLASFCVTTCADDLPAAALESGRQLILDTIGVSLLASTHKIGRLISAQAAELGGHAQHASVFGAGNLKVAPVFAALANGTMANALDYDAGGHLPTHILPAILAVAEAD